MRRRKNGNRAEMRSIRSLLGLSYRIPMQTNADNSTSRSGAVLP